MGLRADIDGLRCHLLLPFPLKLLAFLSNKIEEFIRGCVRLKTMLFPLILEPHKNRIVENKGPNLGRWHPVRRHLFVTANCKLKLSLI